MSLAGRRSKLLVVRDPDGRWGIPRDGHASTHLLEPEDERYPGMVANEAFCLRVAGSLGLTTIQPEVVHVAGRPVLVVDRYDRARGTDGRIVRHHQEDVCQALGIDTSRDDAKYEAFGGPSYRQAADLLDRFNGLITELDRLTDDMTLTVALGNADAHGKDLSLLHRGKGVVDLAPLYDVISTIHYPTVSTPDGERAVSTDLAMRVAGRCSLHEVTRDDLVSESVSWGYPRRRAADRVGALLERLPAALAAAAAETADLPGGPTERIGARVVELAAGRPASAG